MRTPYVMVRRMLGWNKGQVFNELFPSSYRYSFEKGLTKDETKEFYPAVAATAFVHSCKDGFIPHGWKYVSPKTSGIHLPGFDSEDKCLYSQKTGCKITIIEKDNERIIAFGSLEADGGDGTKAKNPASGKVANVIQSILGITPRAFTQLDEVIPILLSHPDLQGKNVVFTGNSYGATLAQYVGLQFQKKAVCFNSFALGSGPQYWIGAQKLKEADLNVTHITVKGDFVTDLRAYKPLDLFFNGLGVKTPGNFGRRFTIPTAYPGTWLATHGYTLGSVTEHLGHGTRAHPADIVQP